MCVETVEGLSWRRALDWIVFYVEWLDVKERKNERMDTTYKPQFTLEMIV